MLSGCFENCLPWRFALRFALVVAAYSPDVRALIAASGRYRSPVTEFFLPLMAPNYVFILGNSAVKYFYSLLDV